MHRRLRRAYGEFVPKKRRPILDEIVLTVLSQHTSDVNSGRAFASLKRRFPTWQEVIDAPTDELADAIRSGGIAQVKAARIQAILHAIEEREGSMSTRRLSRLSDDDARDYLLGLPGVGPKTAACVLLFSMRRPAFPVDTHVHRVARRLGLIGPKVTEAQAHSALGDQVPPELRYEFHVQLIRHGREICKPRMPLCSECVLLDLCAAGPELLSMGAAR